MDRQRTAADTSGTPESFIPPVFTGPLGGALHRKTTYGTDIMSWRKEPSQAMAGGDAGNDRGRPRQLASIGNKPNKYKSYGIIFLESLFSIRTNRRIPLP